MKKFLLLLALAAAPLAARAQSVGIGTATPNAAAALDVTSTTQGLLYPRLSQPQRDAITATGQPGGAALGAGQAGLTVFNTTTSRLNFWDGTRWQEALSGALQPSNPSTFGYTGGAQTYTVPPGVAQVQVVARGAGGGTYFGAGGLGAQVTAVLAVVPGEVLTVQVGGQAGYNGGGAGNDGGPGGGASDVRQGGAGLAQRVVVAGGGGGGGNYNTETGGAGGLPTGGNGATSGGGWGATPAAAGSGGNGCGPTGAGGLGQGGSAVAGFFGGGGGGGGYYGGSSGTGGLFGCFAGGGGGGSSFATDAAATYAAGGGGDGAVVISLLLLAPVFNGTNLVNVPGDNLGNHAATQALNLQANALVGTGASISGVGVGVRADGGLNLGQNTAGNNVFVGYRAGQSTTGSFNQFSGYQSGALNTSGSNNWGFGYQAGPTTGTLTNAGAIGYQARVSQSNSLVLGGTGTNAVSVGIGTSAPAATLHVAGPAGTSNVRLSSLGGTGSRVVLADADGDLAPAAAGSMLARLAAGQAGTATVGPSNVGVSQRSLTVTFPVAFAAVPGQVLCTVRTETGQVYGDVFAATTRSITATGFVVNVQRTDASAAWGQALLLDWLALP